MHIMNILHCVNINKRMLFISKENYLFGLSNTICSPIYFPTLFLKAFQSRTSISCLMIDHYSPMNLTKVGSGGERAAEQARTEWSKDQLLPASSKSGLTPQVPGHRQRPGSWVRQELDSRGWQRGRRG